MIQLDNTTKGHKVETLTPQEEELNGRIEKLPVITHLQEQDSLIMEKLGSLEIGQTEIEERLDAGADQFKQLWSKVGDMSKSIEDLGKTFNDGIDKLTKEIFNSKLDSALSQNTKMAQENQELKNKLEKQDDKAWDVKKIVITAVIGLAMLGVGIALGWK